MSEVNGLAAKFSFRSRGISCTTSRAGWVDPVHHIDQPGVRVHLVCATRRDEALDVNALPTLTRLFRFSFADSLVFREAPLGE